ncbi:Synaptotagmin-like protein 4 [Geodia barretti]|uniref:Synaptotagmin-like protein 4 n=1 Tax=Geodia barretti TaxID=519541 RepID=A0AA35TJ82_GEOBA|nr:Synaptotagmin-like protein 4 [Geodia barretti]
MPHSLSESSSTLCLPVCARKRLLDIQAAHYVSLPTADFSPSPLFGSQLVMMSLEVVQTAEPSKVNPYNGKARKNLNTSLSRSGSADSNNKPRSGTNESSIIVRYTNTDQQQQGTASGRSDSAMSMRSNTSSLGHRERPTSLAPARRVSPSEYSDSDEEDERNVLEVPGLSKIKHSESMGSLSSMYSAIGGKGDYAISGEVRFGVWYSRDGLLKVHVEQARDLAAARKEGYSYPYVKVYLLPDRTKHTKRKTGFMRRTVSPRYDETFKVHIRTRGMMYSLTH